jgi:hypothetical protein
MNRHHSFGRITIACALIVVAVATTAHSQPYGRYDYHNYHKIGGKYGPTLSYPSPTKIMNLLNGRPNYPAKRRVAQRATPSRTTRLNDLNLSLTMPSGPWMKLDPQETGSRARYLITRRNPTIIISLAGERGRTDAQLTNSSLLAESQEKLKSLGADVEHDERQLSAAGIDGLAYTATIVDGEFTTYYALWVATHNGYTYKLAVYGNAQNRPMIDAAMHNFVRNIRPLQPTRVAHRTSHNKATPR